MKKYLCILISICFIFLTFASCKGTSPNHEEKTTQNEDSTSSSSVEEIPSSSKALKTPLLPLPQEGAEFSFLSGAGAWRTVIFLNSDGTFTGEYLDSEMGDMDEAYPNGSAYVSSFSGNFENIKKVNDYSYEMTLSNTKVEITVGTEWYGDGIRYVASEPYGIEEGTDFIFYLPNTPINMVPPEFLTWWPYRYEQNENPKATLDCYGILNVSTGYGFFYIA